MGYKHTFLLLIFILIAGLARAEELPVNTWVKIPETEEFRDLDEFRLMISSWRRPKGSNWLFINKWFNYSSTAQGTWISDIKKVLFINGHGSTTWLYDPVEGGDWKRKLARREKPSGWKNMQPGGDTYKGALRWGSLCYDPINREVVLFGGNCAEPGGTPGTRVYSIEKNEWKKLDFSGSPLAKLHAGCEKLRLNVRKLEGRLRSRLNCGEIPEEKKEDLEALAQDVSYRILLHPFLAPGRPAWSCAHAC
ncbi:hypothetical protein ACFL6F_02770 [Planctomycetota bacterium]